MSQTSRCEAFSSASICPSIICELSINKNTTKFTFNKLLIPTKFMIIKLESLTQMLWRNNF